MLLRLPANRFFHHLLFWMVVSLFLLGVRLLIILIYSDISLINLSDYLSGFFYLQLPTTLFYAYGFAYGLLPLVLRKHFVWFSGGVVLLVLLTWCLYNILDWILYSIVLPLLENQSTTVISQKITTLHIFDPTFLKGPIQQFSMNLVAGFLTGTRLYSQWYQKQRESQRLEREKLQTELKLLKLQLNPTFLFNSLTTLHHVSQTQPKQAPDIVLHLSHFLRYILYESQTDRVPLIRETEVIEHYVSLQRSMHPDCLEVSLTVRGNGYYQEIVPLVLFQIVENAFQSIITDENEPAWVSIDLVIDEAYLTLKVINGQMVTQTDKSNQLADIQKQLYFHYADAYDLQIRAEPDAYIITLTLPLVVLTAPLHSGRLNSAITGP